MAKCSLLDGIITAGNEYTCATVAGGVQCWGDNVFGQLGNGSNVPKSFVRVVVSGLSGVQQIAAGASHVCAIAYGAASCWGANLHGQLGNNAMGTPPPDAHAPVSVSGLSSGVQAIAAGDQHTCAIVNGGAQCWGNNANGQLGNNATANPPPDSRVPIPVFNLLSGVEAIATGGSHTCAIVNGSVRCWGLNHSRHLTGLSRRFLRCYTQAEQRSSYRARDDARCSWRAG